MGQTGQATLKEGHSTAGKTEETLKIQAWYSGPLRNPSISEIYRAADQEAPVSEVGEGDCPGPEKKTEFCQWGNLGTTGGSGGLSCWPI